MQGLCGGWMKPSTGGSSVPGGVWLASMVSEVRTRTQRPGHGHRDREQQHAAGVPDYGVRYEKFAGIWQHLLTLSNLAL